MKILSSMSVSVLLLAAVAAAQDKPAASGLRIEKAVVATAVENREPTGESKEFEASVGTVYCWTKVVAETVPATIKHVWYEGEKQVFEKPLEIKFPSTRTWSAKAVKSGSWRVDVTDEAGAVLASVSFTVK